MDREVEEATFAGDENEMTTESGYNHLQSEFFITSSFSSVDNNNIAYNSDQEVSSNIGHHHAHHSSSNSMMHLHTNFGDTFFIKSFTTSSHLETFYVCLFMFFLAIIYNSLKSYQYHLNQKRPSFDEETCYPVAEKFSESDSAGGKNHHLKSWIKCLLSMHNFLDTFIHILLVAIGYSMMLAIMSFNVWILVSVILGEAIGYFMFGHTRRIQNADNNQSDNSCFFLQTSPGNFNEKEPK